MAEPILISRLNETTHEVEHGGKRRMIYGLVPTAAVAMPGDDRPTLLAVLLASADPAQRQALGRHLWSQLQLPSMPRAGDVRQWKCYRGRAPGTARVIRGGSWNNNDPSNVRGANRNRNEPGQSNNNLGFRCARGGRACCPGATAPGPVLGLPPPGGHPCRCPSWIASGDDRLAPAETF